MITSCPAAEALQAYNDMQRCRKCKKIMGFTRGSFPCPYCGKKSKIKPEPRISYDKPQYANPQYKMFLYESSSFPGTKYTVKCTQKNQFVSCNCPGFLFRKNCWHMRDAIDNKGKKSIKAKGA